MCRVWCGCCVHYMAQCTETCCGCAACGGATPGKYKYNFRRTTLSAYLRSRWVLHLLTLLSLAMIVLLVHHPNPAGKDLPTPLRRSHHVAPQSGYVWKVIGYFSTGEGRSWHSWLVPDYNHFVSGLFLVSFAGTLKLFVRRRHAPLDVLLVDIYNDVAPTHFFVRTAGVRARTTAAMGPRRRRNCDHGHHHPWHCPLHRSLQVSSFLFLFFFLYVASIVP